MVLAPNCLMLGKWRVLVGRPGESARNGHQAAKANYKRALGALDRRDSAGTAVIPGTGRAGRI